MNKNYISKPLREFSDILHNAFPEFAEQEKRVRTITFQVTEDCCMACTYCYQNCKSKNKMSFETAKKFIDDLLSDKYEIASTQNTCGIIIDFIGGEPLLEIDLMNQILSYILDKMIEKRHPWLFYSRANISSNGLLYFDPKVQQFLNKFGRLCNFNVSIDGNKELHDACRVDLNGKGTYDRAMSAVHAHREKFGNNPDTKMTISPENVPYLSDALINLINEKYTTIMCNCIYEKGWNNEHANVLYNQLKIIADYLIENNLYNKIFIRMFDEDNFAPLPEEDNENWCGGAGDMCTLAVNYKGDIYPCIRYMESSLNGKQPPIPIGDICNGCLNKNSHKNNFRECTSITRRSQSTDECFYCPIAKGCGWCSAYNYEEFGTVNKRATYTCPTHKATALANVYYWNRLYQYLNLNKVFKMHIPKEWALQIIDINEYNYLQNLSKEREF